MEYTEREQALLNDTDVAAHIKRENEAVAKRAKEEGWTSWWTVSPDIAKNYSNVYEYEFEMACETYSDMYKEKRGFRPRRDFSDKTLAYVEALIELGW